MGFRERERVCTLTRCGSYCSKWSLTYGNKNHYLLRYILYSLYTHIIYNIYIKNTLLKSLKRQFEWLYRELVILSYILQVDEEVKNLPKNEEAPKQLSHSWTTICLSGMNWCNLSHITHVLPIIAIAKLNMIHLCTKFT